MLRALALCFAFLSFAPQAAPKPQSGALPLRYGVAAFGSAGVAPD